MIEAQQAGYLALAPEVRAELNAAELVYETHSDLFASPGRQTSEFRLAHCHSSFTQLEL